MTLLCFMACKKEETPIVTPIESIASYSFVDQNLQGYIEATVWDMNFGIINDHRLFGNDYYFYFYNASDTNHCDGVDPKTDCVSFALKELKPQLIELNFSNSFRFYDNSDSISIRALNGAVEILTVDTTNGMTITGRMDVRESSTTFVNGNFSVTYCL
jgi:hypothetical protein